MLYLYEEKRQPCHEEVSLLEKLNYCSCFATAATANDQLPKYICMSCSLLVENAYQLKVLCGKTEEKFHDFYQRTEQHTNYPELVTEPSDPVENFQLEEAGHRNILLGTKNEDEDM